MNETNDEKSLPEFPPERLAGFGVEVLADLLHLHEDRLPRTVIDECARRGDAMIEVLAEFTGDPTYWDEDCGAGEWWALFHSVMILGLVPGERASDTLIEYMRRIDAEEDENLQEWLDGYWPALFANKPASALDALRAFATDRRRGWYMRLQAMDSVVAAGERSGSEALDAALDWSARIIADETESWDLRLMASTTLLAFPRDRHRALLDQIARRQSRREAAFTANDVAKAYAGEAEPPDWRQREHPWEFYDPEHIAERLEHWDKLEAEADQDEEAVATFVRESPKVATASSS